MQIAIDGPVGSGKSTLARAAAAKLGYLYIDTGAMYRTFGLYAVREGRDLGSPSEIEAALAEGFRGSGPIIHFDIHEGILRSYIGGRDVSREIRTAEAGTYASRSAAYGVVRKKIVELQRIIAAGRDVVMDGRDIGTVVLPNAEVKIYLTATAEERARRRLDELRAMGDDQPYEDILRGVMERDIRDSTRAESPLRQAADAVLVDTTGMSAERALERVLEIIRARLGGAEWS